MPQVGSDSAGLHARMLDRLLQSGAIRTAAVEQAFRSVSRHLFLPGVPLDEVYSGKAIPTQFGPDGCATSSSSMPAIMAIMLEQLAVRPGDHVLEIGAGTGYNAAVLAALVGPTGAVTTVDIDADVAGTARRNLARTGPSAIDVRTGDGWLGVSAGAPYDRIEVTVGVWDLSPHWYAQLRAGGVLVAPLWLRAGIQTSIALRRKEDHLEGLSVEPCGFMRLRGPHAGPERYVKIDEWDATLDRAGDDEIAVLRDLCRKPPRDEPAPSLPRGWFVPIALEEPGALTLSRWTEDRHAMGIFDPVHGSLAVVVGERVLTFGGSHARERLLETLHRTRPVNLRALRIDAVPLPATGPAEPLPGVLARARPGPHRRPGPGSRRRWTLARTHFEVVLSE